MDKRAVFLFLTVVAIVLASWWLRGRPAERPVDDPAPPPVPAANSRFVAPRAQTPRSLARQTAVEARKRPPSPYNRFVFVRESVSGAVDKSRILVLCTINGDDFSLQEFPVKGYGVLHPMFASETTVYGMSDALSRLDLTTGVELQSREKADSTASNDVEWTGRCYALARDGAQAGMYIYDLAHDRRRSIVLEHQENSYGHVISPDGRHVAYFESPVGDIISTLYGMRLTVIDLVNGTSKHIGPNYAYTPSAISSDLIGGPPMVWMDAKSLCIMGRRSSPEAAPSLVTPEERAVFVELADPQKPNTLIRIDIETGADKELVAIPGTVMDISRLYWNARAKRVEVSVGSLRYGLDSAGKRLVELDHDTAPFETPTSAADPATAASAPTGGTSGNAPRYDRGVVWSPDGRRAVWEESPSSGYGFNMLLYRDDDDLKPRTVVENCPIIGGPIWCIPSDRVPEAPDEGAPGWEPIAFGPPPPKTPDTRVPFDTRISLTVTTDKSSYLLHEPIMVTATITNIGNEAVRLPKPRLFSTGPLRCTLKRSSETSVEHEELGFSTPHDQEEIDLEPGASLTDSQDLELSQAGDYELGGTLNATYYDKYRGQSAAKPVLFSVRDSGDDRLLVEKIARLIETARADFLATRKDTEDESYYNGAAADALRKLGGAATPALIAAFDQEPEPAFRDFLRRVLVNPNSPDALPFFLGLLRDGDRNEQSSALSAILGQAVLQSTGPESAGFIARDLMTVVKHPDESLRREAVRAAINQHGPVADALLEQALGDVNDEICGLAAVGLALRSEENLADWLREIAANPTRENTCAGQVMLERIEEMTHDSFGGTDAPLSESLLRCAEWATANPATAQRVFPARGNP